MIYACLKCFESFPEWAGLLLRCRCPHCGAVLEEIAAEPEEVLRGEY